MGWVSSYNWNSGLIITVITCDSKAGYEQKMQFYREHIQIEWRRKGVSNSN